LIFTRRPQRVLYYYWLDANFGLMYLRLQTYFPYTMQVYVNGHDWLARQMTHWGLGFVQHDNAFVELDHPQRLNNWRIASKKRKKRTYAGFNPARPDHAQLFRAVLSGDHLLRGFYNAQIRQALWGQHLSADQRRRQARKVTRLLKRLHLRGLLAKIPPTRRWPVTALGQQVLGALVQLHYHGLATAR